MVYKTPGQELPRWMQTEPKASTEGGGLREEVRQLAAKEGLKGKGNQRPIRVKREQHLLNSSRATPSLLNFLNFF